jgi:16S rRNA processing protein RimM
MVIEVWSNRPERTQVGAELFAGDRRLEIEAVSDMAASAGHPRRLVAFRGVRTREDAETLRDRVLTAEPLEVEGALWVHEMVGSDLWGVGGEVVGRIEAVEANPASDLLVLEDGRVVPLTFVRRDAEGRLTVDGPPGLLDP